MSQTTLTTPAQRILGLVPKEDAAPTLVADLLSSTGGIIPLQPEFVPRDFLLPGRRLGIAMEDQYAYGPHRGALCERWIASCTTCDNGPLTLPFEGISKAIYRGQRIPLTWICREQPKVVLGHLADLFGVVPGYYNKLFDFLRHIPHHLHQQAQKSFVDGKPCMLGAQRMGKHEGYKHLTQYNHPMMSGEQVCTWFGLRPGTTAEDLIRAFEEWSICDNRILRFAQAQLIGPHVNWFVPSDYLHAPGPMLTEEPQEGTDVFSMFQNVVEGKYTPDVLLKKNFDPAIQTDPVALAAAVDLALNAKNPHDFMIYPSLKQSGGEFVETWEVFGRDPEKGYVPFVLVETVIGPGKSLTLSNEPFHSVFCVEGAGLVCLPDRTKVQDIRAPRVFRFGEPSYDEYLITAERAKEGVRYLNHGNTPLVLHRCFGRDSFPDNQIPQVGLAHRADPEILIRAREAALRS